MQSIGTNNMGIQFSNFEVWLWESKGGVLLIIDGWTIDNWLREWQFQLYGCMCHRMAGFVWVLGEQESPGILFWHVLGLESPEKRLQVLDSLGN